MGAPKKFGTFAGVYTPSVLTILGVIMYMRMGWVVGNAGLWGTLIIVLIAHVISATTGLSIASIATDKKVGAGGVYYVLSRSLGLPIGGAIGLTLFVGTALSISLYLIGFSESLNAYFELGNTLNDYRISASIALLLLTVVAIISTSVALKMQFFIMAAIAFSLVSILMGTREFTPSVIPFFGDENAVSLEHVFAVFFPAVTGFTAGIAMSGDLKDPKKSIPLGTIWSIATGLVVYIGLTFFIAYTVNSDLLKSDYNILMNIAAFAPAVVAGIWGATLSSALGGILGGPRILQAMSIDKITPRFLGKGSGKSNEPRNALIFAVIIAEAGILIGELDLIAEVVSMFFLAAYGFINLSFVLESWASSDFNPSFKIKKWVGAIGFIATFAVMFKLNMFAMLAAFVIIGGIYFYLAKKQLALNSGDIWHSVWSSVVKSGLKRMDARESHKRHWKPNILLFSGGTDARPHLIEFSKALAGKLGMISNFDLIENPEAKIMFPKHAQSLSDKQLGSQGIFARRQEVKNIFQGIETIASTYGFSGVEPNTVLMGWAKNTKDPLWFGQMTKKLIDLDYNVFYLDYDEKKGFGNRKKIDIWWRNIENNAELSLNVLKFLTSSEEWRRAEVRVILVNNSLKEGLERKINELLNEYRIAATVKVFQNAVEQKPFYELMKITSDIADLIITGIPEIETGKEKEFVTKTNEILGILGTTLLIKASTKLGGDNIDDSASPFVQQEKISATSNQELSLHLEFPEEECLAAPTKEVFAVLNNKLILLLETHLSVLKNNRISLIHNVEKEFKQLHKSNETRDDFVELEKVRTQLLVNIQKYLINFLEEDVSYIADRLLELYRKQVDHTEEIAQFATYIIRELSDSHLRPDKQGVKRVESVKFWKRFWKTIGIKPRLKIELRELINWHLQNDYLANTIKLQQKISLSSHEFYHELRNTIGEVIQLLAKPNSEKEINERLALLKNLITDQHQYFADFMHQLVLHTVQNIATDLKKIEIEKIISERKNKRTKQFVLADKLFNQALRWENSEKNLVTITALDVGLKRVKNDIKKNLNAFNEELENSLYKGMKSMLSDTKKSLTEIKNAVDRKDYDFLATTIVEMEDVIGYDDIVINQLLAELNQLSETLPETVEVLEHSVNEKSNESGNPITVDTQRITSYVIETKIILSLERELPIFPNQLREAVGHIRHQLRLLTFHLNTHHDDKKFDAKSLTEIIAKAERGISEAESQLDEYQRRANEKIEAIFLDGISQLNPGYIIGEAEKLDHYLHRNIQARGIKQIVQKIIEKSTHRVNKYGRLISSKREDLLFADFQQKHEHHVNIHQELRRYLKQISPSNEVLDKLPLYYKQLFIGKHTANKTFLKNRHRELRYAKEAVERLNSASKIGGGILVIGEPLSGKTFFAEVVAKDIISKNKIYRIEPPLRGSINIKDLQRVLQKQIGTTKSIEEAIKDAPKKSTFLFNDLELWWQRSTDGRVVIDAITRLISKYSNQHYFIVNCNIHAFQLIKQQGHFHSYFISTIHLAPLSQQGIKESILSRHHAGGYQFIYENKNEDQLNEKVLSQIFASHTNASDGNIGFALLQWIGNIKSVQDNHKLTISSPRNNELPTINKNDWLVLLAQFFMHKHLTINRIKQIFGYENNEKVIFIIQNLQRAGLIEEFMGGIYRVSPFVYIPLKKQLKTYQLI